MCDSQAYQPGGFVSKSLWTTLLDDAGNVLPVERISLGDSIMSRMQAVARSKSWPLGYVSEWNAVTLERAYREAAELEAVMMQINMALGNPLTRRHVLRGVEWMWCTGDFETRLAAARHARDRVNAGLHPWSHRRPVGA